MLVNRISASKVVLLGNSGTGKTSMLEYAIAIAHRFTRFRPSGAIVR
jgi:recombinational DNA repair ATPase RecF